MAEPQCAAHDLVKLIDEFLLDAIARIEHGVLDQQIAIQIGTWNITT